MDLEPAYQILLLEQKKFCCQAFSEAHRSSPAQIEVGAPELTIIAKVGVL